MVQVSFKKVVGSFAAKVGSDAACPRSHGEYSWLWASASGWEMPLDVASSNGSCTLAHTIHSHGPDLSFCQIRLMTTSSPIATLVPGAASDKKRGMRAFAAGETSS